MRLTSDGQVSVFRDRSNHTNGNTRDRQGRLVTCEHQHPARDAHRDRRHHHRACRPLRGQAAQLAQRRRGAGPTARSGSPIRTTGCVSTLPGGRKDQAHDNVFRLDPVDRRADRRRNRLRQAQRPRLLARREARSTSPTPPSPTARARTPTSAASGERRRHADAAARSSRPPIGIPDGMRVDIAGNVWASAGAKIDVYAPDATLARADRRLPGAGDQPRFRRCRTGPQLFVTAGGACSRSFSPWRQCHRLPNRGATRRSLVDRVPSRAIDLCTIFQRRNVNAELGRRAIGSRSWRASLYAHGRIS